jgi:hypothetical protein
VAVVQVQGEWKDADFVVVCLPNALLSEAEGHEYESTYLEIPLSEITAQLAIVPLIGLAFKYLSLKIS